MKEPRPMTASSPTLTLCVPVYRGGAYWRECWETVRPLAGQFAEIVVGLNGSPLQEEDRAVVEQAPVPNLRVFRQEQPLPSREHGVFLRRQLRTDYVLFLCHDDWLLPEGVAELRGILDRHGGGGDAAVFGAHAWTGTPTRHPGITRELAAHPDGIGREAFIAADIDRFFTFNLSGLAAPVAALQRWDPVLQLFQRGFRSDNFQITNPDIRRIHQTTAPVARIRIHDAQEGAAPDPDSRFADNLVYYFVAALYARDPVLRRRCIQQFSLRRPLLLARGLARLLAACRCWPAGADRAAFAREFLRWLCLSVPRRTLREWRRS